MKWPYGALHRGLIMSKHGAWCKECRCYKNLDYSPNVCGNCEVATPSNFKLKIKGCEYCNDTGRVPIKYQQNKYWWEIDSIKIFHETQIMDCVHCSEKNFLSIDQDGT